MTHMFVFPFLFRCAHTGFWNPVGQTLTGTANFDFFGNALDVSADGSIMAVASPSADDATGSVSVGRVQVYSINTSTNKWQQLGQDLFGRAASDRFGRGLALSDDGLTLVVTSEDAGYAVVYEYNSSSNIWVQLGNAMERESADDEFGSAVDISACGCTVVIGGSFPGLALAGNLRMFRYASGVGEWVQVGATIFGEDDSFGDAVAISDDGNIAAAGGYRNDGAFGTESGHVRVFQFDGTDWNQLGQDVDGEASFDFFGRSVSLSGDGVVLAAGAKLNKGGGESAGHVRVFRFNDGVNSWQKVGPDINGLAANDNLGVSVALSKDASILAAGGDGHVRIFEYNSVQDDWKQLGENVDGLVENDDFGFSLAMSADGGIVAAGAPESDDSGEKSGHVRVFRSDD